MKKLLEKLKKLTFQANLKHLYVLKPIPVQKTSNNNSIIYSKRIIYILIFFVLTRYSIYSLSLNQAIREGIKNNPELKTSFWKMRSLLEKENAADGGSPTKFNLGILNIPTDSFSLNQDMMNQVIFSVKQKIFFPGKLSLKKDIAREMRRIAEWNHEAKKRRIKALIKETYFRIEYLKTTIKLSKNTLNLLQQFKRIAQTRYAVGKGVLQDMAKADFEVSRLKEKIIKLENNKKTTTFFFNHLLGRTSNTSLKKIKLFSGKMKKIHLAKINNLVLYKSTSIKIAQHKLEKAKWKRKLASRMYMPDFGFASSYGMRTKKNSADLFSINFEISIPIFTKRSKKVKALRKQVESQKSSLKAAHLDALKTASTLFTSITTKRKLLRLYKKELIPLAKLSVRSALSAYQVGKLEFISLVTAQLLLYHYQVMNENNKRSYRTHYAHLEFLTGKKLMQGVQ